MKLTTHVLVLLGVIGLAVAAQPARASAYLAPVTVAHDPVPPVPKPQTVTYTLTAATGEIQYKDENGNWQTLITCTQGHVFVTDTEQEGNYRFLPRGGWTRTVS